MRLMGEDSFFMIGGYVVRLAVFGCGCTRYHLCVCYGEANERDGELYL
jgi:hypothetical protein